MRRFIASGDCGRMEALQKKLSEDHGYFFELCNVAIVKEKKRGRRYAAFCYACQTFRISYGYGEKLLLALKALWFED